MTRGVSQWIWPLELPNHTLDSKVQRACHALSIDDERTTFHPVLWNERKEPNRTGARRYTKEERISQVWFAGMHANVGGGYGFHQTKIVKWKAAEPMGPVVLSTLGRKRRLLFKA
jgi:uncharacterized protein (DUF2235 family)